MKATATLLSLAASAAVANAHATVWAMWVNGKDMGVGNSPSGYIRAPPNNFPIENAQSPDLACNVNGGTPAAKWIPVAPGDTVELEWAHDNRGDDIIASSHLGPVMTYIAPADSNGAGPVWHKIAQDGFDGAWAVTRLIGNRGKHAAKIPNVAPGRYLLRAEIIALHQGNRQGGAQFYMECVQVEVAGGSGAPLPPGVSFPGAYKADDPGVLFDVYNSFSSYPIPGPAPMGGRVASKRFLA